MNRTLRILLPLVTTLAVTDPALAFDRGLWAEQLARHTRAVEDTAGTRVEYAALRRDPDWRRLVAGLDASEPPAPAARAETLAFWIDVYNVLAIDWIVREGPVASIRDLGSWLRPVWKRPAGRVGGREVSLDEIEHHILRPLGEPRIHFAIVCASTSCPSLQREPFRAADLDRQLDARARTFLADPRKGLALERAAGRARVSKILDWFAADFGGRDGVVAFVAAHAPPDSAAWLSQHTGDVELAWFDYDWRVNAIPGRE
ncbi:MAG TPA: DUF547 domain-containing protein [Myxococcota bacterium]|nr:DUF547 domain-containing protein [Myxococcota bacterium]